MEHLSERLAAVLLCSALCAVGAGASLAGPAAPNKGALKFADVVCADEGSIRTGPETDLERRFCPWYQRDRVTTSVVAHSVPHRTGLMLIAEKGVEWPEREAKVDAWFAIVCTEGERFRLCTRDRITNARKLGIPEEVLVLAAIVTDEEWGINLRLECKGRKHIQAAVEGPAYDVILRFNAAQGRWVVTRNEFVERNMRCVGRSGAGFGGTASTGQQGR